MNFLFPRFQRLFPTRVWHQIFFVLLFVTVTSLIILGTALIRASQTAIKTSIFHNYKEVAIHATGEVSENIKGAQRTLLVTASILGTLQADFWKQETSIVELSLQYPMFERIASVNLNGQEIVSSELGEMLLDQSDDEAFIQAKHGRNYISDIQIVQDNVPFLTMSVPIRQMGRIQGVLMAKVNIRSIWDLIDSIRFGQTGVAYLITTQGRIIAHPDKKRVFQDANTIDTINPDILTNIRLRQTGNSMKKDLSGRAWLLSYAPVVGLDWGLIISQQESEAYASLGLLKMKAAMLTVLIICGVVLISLILSHYMSRPIQDLIHGTELAAKGDFTHSVRVRRRDDIGRLIFGYNKMVSRLRKAQQVENLSIVGKAASKIAHELKNSLSLVNTFIHLLPQHHTDKNFVQDFFQTISKELDSWKMMLKSMSDLAKLEEFPMTEIRINDLLMDIISFAQLRVRQKGIHLNVHMTDALPPIIGNVNQLRQVFLNLLTNAIEAVPPGGSIFFLTHFVNSTDQSIPSYAEIRITNTGLGISGADFEKIFEPFYTTKKNGLGLGLSISKEIIVRHGGYIDVSSQDNKGVTFSIRIPKSSTAPNDQQLAPRKVTKQA